LPREPRERQTTHGIREIFCLAMELAMDQTRKREDDARSVNPNGELDLGLDPDSLKLSEAFSGSAKLSVAVSSSVPRRRTSAWIRR